MLLEIADERGDEMIEDRQQRTHPIPNAAIRRDVISVIVPCAGSGMVAQVDGDETRAALDKPSCQQRLPAPVVIAVTLDDPGRLTGEIEGFLRASAGDDV